MKLRSSTLLTLLLAGFTAGAASDSFGQSGHVVHVSDAAWMADSNTQRDLNSAQSGMGNVIPVGHCEAATHDMGVVCDSGSDCDAAWSDEMDSCCAPKSCQPRTTINLDYLFLWTEGTRLPALVTTSPNGTAQGDAGVLGAAGTSILYGDGDFFDQFRSGGRFQMVHRLHNGLSLDGSYFGAGDAGNDGFFASSDGNPILARPFFDTQAGTEAAQLIAFEDGVGVPLVAGSVTARLDSQLHSANIAMRFNRRRGCNRSLDFLAGYRYFNYSEGLRVEESLTSTNPVGLIQVGTTLDLYDDIDLDNQFHGGEFGMVGFHDFGKISVEGVAKVALGSVKKTATVDGRTIVETPGGGISNRAGGLLARASELGEVSQVDFGVLTEVGAKIRYDIKKNMSLAVGYNLFVLSDAIRLGDVVDRKVDPRELTTFDQNSQVLANSAPDLEGSSFWAQSLSLGLSIER